jgi:hypothetical protein
MASRNGSASAVPSPRKTVRRDNAVLVTNIYLSKSLVFTTKTTKPSKHTKKNNRFLWSG